MMKLTSASLALLAVSSVSAQAVEPAIGAGEPVVAVVTAKSVADWSGYYAGLAIGRSSGHEVASASFGDRVLAQHFNFEDETSVGGLVGYNFQRGNFVFGGEIGYSPSFGLMVDPEAGDGNDFIENMLDVRVRAGYAVDKFLFYGALGYARGEMTLEDVEDDATLTGHSVSVGVDYMLTSKFFAGLEYTKRDIDGRSVSGDFDIDSDIKTVTFRAGIKF